jgi:hypothetical protein
MCYHCVYFHYHVGIYLPKERYNFLFREQHGDKVGTSDSKGWSNDFFINVGKLNNKGQLEQI